MERRWRVHCAELPCERDATIDLDAEESHHVRRVLRRRVGDALSVFDGRGRERCGVIVAAGARQVSVRLGEEIDDPVDAPLEVVLFQALCRSERMDWLIQKGTEIGLADVRPVPGQRSDAPAPSAERLRRWRRIALEACKQSGRRRMPAITPAEALPGVPEPTRGFLLDPGPRAVALGRLLGPAPQGPVWIAAGPEGGFSAEEVERGAGLGWAIAGLGPRTLRAETAGLVAATIVLHRWGDVGSGGPAG